MTKFEQSFFAQNNDECVGFPIEFKYDNNNENEIYCFVEGHEDKIFYSDLYEKSTAKDAFFFQCNGVERVENSYKYITQNKIKYNIDRFAFFRDRDYSDKQTQDHMYVTPCYSLENLCLNKSTLEKILQNCLNIPKHNSDYCLILEKYAQAEKDYLKSISHINAFFWCRFEESSQIIKHNLKSIDDILCDTFDEKNIHFDNNLKLQECTKSHFKKKNFRYLTNKSEYKLKSKSIYNSKKTNYDINYYRGKFIVPFFIKFVKRLFENLSSKTNRVTTKKYKTKKKILNNDLEQFFVYTKIPLCLTNFIKKKSKA